jgi:hypothetical protein
MVTLAPPPPAVLLAKLRLGLKSTFHKMYKYLNRRLEYVKVE